MKEMKQQTSSRGEEGKMDGKSENVGNHEEKQSPTDHNSQQQKQSKQQHQQQQSTIIIAAMGPNEGNEKQPVKEDMQQSSGEPEVQETEDDMQQQQHFSEDSGESSNSFGNIPEVKAEISRETTLPECSGEKQPAKYTNDIQQQQHFGKDNDNGDNILVEKVIPATKIYGESNSPTEHSQQNQQDMQQFQQQQPVQTPVDEQINKYLPDTSSSNVKVKFSDIQDTNTMTVTESSTESQISHEKAAEINVVSPLKVLNDIVSHSSVERSPQSSQQSSSRGRRI